MGPVDRWAVLAALAAGAAVWLGWPPSRTVPLGPARPHRPGPARGLWGAGPHRGISWGHRGWWGSRGWGARAAAARRAAVVELLDGLAAELRAGRGLAEALLLIPSAAAVCPGAVAAAGAGGDVPAALAEAAAASGAEGLAGLAACWRVGEQHGGSLAAALERLADAARAEQALRGEVAAQLAGPRASAVLLALLPGGGLLLGSALGLRPLSLLLGTPVGLGLLFLGTALAALGVLWTERLARSVVADR